MKKMFSARILYGGASLLGFLAIWHIGSLLDPTGRLLPSPLRVLDFLIEGFQMPVGNYTLGTHILWSLSRVIVGYLLAAALGILLGVLMAWKKIGEAVIKPFYLMLRPIPSLAWIPLAIIWFGIGETSKYFIIFIGTLLIIMTNAADGVRSVDRELLGAAKMLGAKESQLFIKVVIPSAIPQIFAGLQVGLGTAWATMLAAEMVGSSEGVGWLIIMGQNAANMIQIFAGIFLIGIVGLFLGCIIRYIERKLCAWNVRGK